MQHSVGEYPAHRLSYLALRDHGMASVGTSGSGLWIATAPDSSC